MTRRVLSIREETSDEKKLREWFEAQQLESPKMLDEAARLLIGLVTGLLGVLFSVLALAAEKLPVYVSLPLVRWSAAAAVALWLAALLAGLAVVTPRAWRQKPGRPGTQRQTFEDILDWKSRWLRTAVIAFGLATVALATLLITALLAV